MIFPREELHGEARTNPYYLKNQLAKMKKADKIY